MSDLVTRAKELAVRAHEPMVPRKDMKRLYNAYVRLLESGRDRIRDLGGECDGVDVMERNDLDLRHARDVLTTPPRHPADEGMAIHACTCATERDRELCMDKQSCRVTFPLAGTP